MDKNYDETTLRADYLELAELIRLFDERQLPKREAAVLRMGEILMRSVATEESAKAMGKILNQGFGDSLSGLRSRSYFMREIENLLIEASAETPTLTAVMVFDLVNFGEINNHLGHPIGDKFITAFGTSLKKTSRQPKKGRKSDIVVSCNRQSDARIGGDEFAAIMPLTNLKEGCADINLKELALKKVCQVLSHRAMQTVAYEYGGADLNFGARAGMAMINGNAYQSFEDIMAAADPKTNKLVEVKYKQQNGQYVLFDIINNQLLDNNGRILTD